jgi:hypothetical protein
MATCGRYSHLLHLQFPHRLPSQSQVPYDMGTEQTLEYSILTQCYRYKRLLDHPIDPARRVHLAFVFGQ